jgi:hypothetical protein
MSLRGKTKFSRLSYLLNSRLFIIPFFGYPKNKFKEALEIKMANPNPQIENLKPNKPLGEKALSRKSIGIKLEPEYYEMYMKLPPKTRGSLIREILQKAIAEASEKQPV